METYQKSKVKFARNKCLLEVTFNSKQIYNEPFIISEYYGCLLVRKE